MNGLGVAGHQQLTNVLKVVFTLLAFTAAAGGVATLIGLVVHRGVFDKGYRWVVGHRAPLTLLVSGVAMLGSLYFSEIALFTPCRMCWFQRYFMYWIAIVGVVAVVVRGQFRRTYRWFALGMAGFGILISFKHILLERGVIQESTSCDPVVPCAVPYFQTFGFVTLAVMAMCAFFAIIVFNAVPARTDTPQEVAS